MRRVIDHCDTVAIANNDTSIKIGLLLQNEIRPCVLTILELLPFVERGQYIYSFGCSLYCVTHASKPILGITKLLLTLINDIHVHCTSFCIVQHYALVLCLT